MPKWLGHIIIRAQFQPTHLIPFLPMRAQHQHRDLRDATNPLQNLEARQPARQTHIEQDHVGLPLKEGIQAARAIMGDMHLNPLPLHAKGQGDGLGNMRIIVNHQQLHENTPFRGLGRPRSSLRPERGQQRGDCWEPAGSAWRERHVFPLSEGSAFLFQCYDTPDSWDASTRRGQVPLKTVLL